MDIHDGKGEWLDLVGWDMRWCRPCGLASEGRDIGTVNVYGPVRVVYGYGTILQLIFSDHFNIGGVGGTSHEVINPSCQISVGKLSSGIDGFVFFHRSYEGITWCGDLLLARGEPGVVVVQSGTTLHELHGAAIVLMDDYGCLCLGIHCDLAHFSYRGQGQNIC